MGLVGTLLGEGHGPVEFFRCLFAGAGTHEFGQVELKDDVHTAFQVKTEVEFLLLDILVRVIEVNLLACDGVEVSLVGVRPDGVKVECPVQFGNLCKRRTLLHLLDDFVGSFGSLAFLYGGRSRERQLEHTGQADENGHKCNGAFALHKCVIFKLIFQIRFYSKVACKITLFSQYLKDLPKFVVEKSAQSQ